MRHGDAMATPQMPRRCHGDAMEMSCKCHGHAMEMTLRDYNGLGDFRVRVLGNSRTRGLGGIWGIRVWSLISS